MRMRILAACALAVSLALARCAPSFDIHLVLRNDAGRTVRILSGAHPDTLVAGRSVEATPRGLERLRIEAGPKLWDYSGSWLSGDFSSWNQGDDQYVRPPSASGPRTVYGVIRPDGRIYIREILNGSTPAGVADPQPSGYPLLPRAPRPPAG